MNAYIIILVIITQGTYVCDVYTNEKSVVNNLINNNNNSYYTATIITNNNAKYS